MQLPKILVIGQPFNNHSGGGITLSNLFSGWNRDQIAVACTGHELSNLDSFMCDTYYLLGTSEQKWAYPFNYLQRKYHSGQITTMEDPVNEVGGKRSVMNRVRSMLIHRIFFPMLNLSGLVHSMSRLVLSEEFRSWLDEFKPEILYTQISERQQILFACELTRYLEIPLVLHIMDDWPSFIGNQGIFRRYWKRKIDGEFTGLVNSASLLMSISDDMSGAYEARYGRKFKAFHNPVDLSNWNGCRKTQFELGDEITVLYAGRIGIGIDKSLETIARAIEKINRQIHKRVKLLIQSKEVPRWFDRYSCVEHHSFVPYEELPWIFASADFLILPYDFRRRSVELFRYSMPTKITEYMISGTPIIVFAPEETAIVNYVKAENAAEVVTNNSVGQLCNVLRKLIGDIERRVEISGNAVRTAETNHNSDLIREQFRATISSLKKKDDR